MNDQTARIAQPPVAHVSITQRCNLNICEYCYARSETEKSDMRFEDFTRMISWLEEVSEMHDVFLLGGEPTVHPRFFDFVDHLAARAWPWKVRLLTNGWFDDAMCERIAAHEGIQEIAFHYEAMFAEKIPRWRGRLESHLARLSPIKSLSFFMVVDRPDFDFHHPLDLAKTYGVQINWFYSTPTAGGTPYMSLEKMRQAGPKAQQFMLDCLAAGVEAKPRQCAPVCTFDLDFYEQYKDEIGLGTRCSPAFYIKQDLSTQLCSNLPPVCSPPPEDREGVRVTLQQNIEREGELRAKHSFDACAGCEHPHRDVCQGGCLAYKLYNYDADAKGA
jgi:MoaA/NifB/PqqE/SkfB family radical SAM enzyme